MGIRMLLFVFAAFSFSSAQESSWFPIRVEYSNNGSDEYGVSSGVWWSSDNDGMPKDAIGPVFGLKAKAEQGTYIPGLNAGVEANKYFLCARVLCNLYKPADGQTIWLLNPQIGLTYLTFINLYLGYNKAVYGGWNSSISRYNMSLCLNMPSYLFASMNSSL